MTHPDIISPFTRLRLRALLALMWLGLKLVGEYGVTVVKGAIRAVR